MGPLKEIDFDGPAHFTREAGEMGVSFNIDRTVDKAYAVGREGNILDRLSERLRASFGGATIAPDIDYRPERARTEVREIASQVDHLPREASVTINGSEVEVTPSRDGYELNLAATMASVDSAIDDMSGKARLRGDVLDPGVITPEAEAAAEEGQGCRLRAARARSRGEELESLAGGSGVCLDVTKQDGKIDVILNRDRLDGRLADVYNDLTVKPKNASYDFDSDGNVVVIPEPRRPERRGGEAARLRSRTASSRASASTRCLSTVDKPQYTTADLEAKKPTELQGTYKTNYTATTDQGPTRVENLEIASEAVNGTFVAPGETFSMVEHVPGPRLQRGARNRGQRETVGRGRRPLPGHLHPLQRGPLRRPAGGRAYAARLALPYIRPGMDATVWYGDTTTTVDDTGHEVQEQHRRLRARPGVRLGRRLHLRQRLRRPGQRPGGDVFRAGLRGPRMPPSGSRTTRERRTARSTTSDQLEERVQRPDTTTKGKKIPTTKVPVAEIDGTYLGPLFLKALVRLSAPAYDLRFERPCRRRVA